MIWNIFSFKTSDGLELYGGLVEAAKTKKPTKSKQKSIVVHIHGMTDEFFDGKVVETVAKAANAAGHDFFAFNNRGAALVTLIKRQFLGTSLERFEDCKKDINGALVALHALGYREFILSGHSTGCQKITYYTTTVKKFPIRALMLLSPADDLNFHKMVLGKNFSKLLKEAEKLTKKNKGDTILAKEFKTPMFSAQRFYHLLKENSIEGNIFNYAKPLTSTTKIPQPILAVFGEEEQYAAIPPDQMLKKIATTFVHKKSKTALVENGDHSFHGEEKALYAILRKFLTTL